MSGWVVEETKYVGETKLVTVDFANELAAGITIFDAVVEASVYAGTDNAPEDIIDGAATDSGTTVSQLVTAGVSGVQYILSFAISTSNGQALVKQVRLAVL